MSVSTLQYHACPTCGPKVLFDYGRCLSCQQPFAAPVVRVAPLTYNNQRTTEQRERNRLRAKAAMKKARQGKATAKSWARRYEAEL